jgi:hypothetical protein
MTNPQLILGQAKNLAFDQDVFRNICSLIVSEDLFDDIADSDDFELAQTIENYAKPPHFISKQPIINRPFEESAWNDSISYPFKNWQESRYSNGQFGVWYSSSDLITGIYETAYHWIKRTLEEEGVLPQNRYIERKVYTVHLNAVLFDLRSLCTEHKGLIHPNNYSLPQNIGKVIHHQGHPGLITQSARCNGHVQAIFTPHVLSASKVNCWLRYIIQGEKILLDHKTDSCPISIPLKQIAPSLV